MKRFLLALTGLALLAVTGTGFARDVEADPSQEYPVTPDIGSWMICVYAYTGPQATQLAHDFVLELRRTYKLPAYVFNRGAEERRKQQEEINRVKQMCPDRRVIRTVRIEEQCAVLVGGYKDMDAASSALKGIKKLKMPDPERVKMDTVVMSNPKTQTIEHALVNPFLHSFVVPNPTAPKEPPPDPNAPDPFQKKLNEGETYSLYKCNKPWTLAVATFEGSTIVQSKENSGSFFDKLFNRDSGERLNAAAMNAHNLATAFRDARMKLGKLGNEVYVLHTRYCSVVCIGGFDSPNDPNIREVQLFIQRMQQSTGALGQGVEFFSPPRPMAVPR